MVQKKKIVYFWLISRIIYFIQSVITYNSNLNYSSIIIILLHFRSGLVPPLRTCTFNRYGRVGRENRPVHLRGTDKVRSDNNDYIIIIITVGRRIDYAVRRAFSFTDETNILYVNPISNIRAGRRVNFPENPLTIERKSYPWRRRRIVPTASFVVYGRRAVPP